MLGELQKSNLTWNQMSRPAKQKETRLLLPTAEQRRRKSLDDGNAAISSTAEGEESSLPDRMTELSV
jgi:hypothetical protein